MIRTRLQNTVLKDNNNVTVIPNVILGNNNGYISGDILDANATVQLIKEGGSGSPTECNSTEYWSSHGDLVPNKGQIIVYTDYKVVDNVNVPGIKIGTGEDLVSELPFIDQSIASDLYEHINNNNVHVTAQEKQMWSNKINIDDSNEVVNGTLILNRN